MKGMRSTTSSIFLIVFLLSIIHNGFVSVGATSETVRLRLVHKYSPHFNRRHGTLINKTEIDIIKELHHRDMTRHQMFFQNRNHYQVIPRRKDLETNSSSLAMPLHSGFDLLSGLYLVEVKIGTPPKIFLLAADTASDVTWIRCTNNIGTLSKEDEQTMLTMERKHHLGDHNESLHIFNKRVFRADLSSTFKPLPCSDGMCSLGLAHMHTYENCPTPLSPCRYNYSYIGGDVVEGFIAYDTITVPLANGSKRKLPNVTIGCTESIFKFTHGDGILGLGFGDYSFSETVVTYNLTQKFSYCLMDHRSHSSVSSYLTFGPNNQTVNGTMTYTELVMMGYINNRPDFYGVKVAGISIGGKLLNIPSQVWDVKHGGGVILDSGYTITVLALPAYKAVMEELEKALSKYKTSVMDGLPFEFCVNSTGLDESSIPRLAFHFADGSRFEPMVNNYVVTPDTTEDWFKCVGFGPANSGMSIIGNQMQQNHLWEFDMQRVTVGFAPSSCI